MGCLRPNPKDTDFWGSWISHLGSYKELQWEIATTTKCFPPYQFFQLFHCLHLTGSFNMCITSFFFFTLPFPPENVTNSHPTFAQKTCRFICVPSKWNINTFFFFFPWSLFEVQFHAKQSTNSQQCNIFAGQLARVVVGPFGIWFGYLQQDLLYLVTSAVLVVEIFICSRKNDSTTFLKNLMLVEQMKSSWLWLRTGQEEVGTFPHARKEWEVGAPLDSHTSHTH